MGKGHADPVATEPATVAQAVPGSVENSGCPGFITDQDSQRTASLRETTEDWP
jgi:hypothetical protein